MAVLAGAAGPIRVVGNLPYNISSPLLIRLLEFRSIVGDQHFMLQKEVVARIVAAPGSRDYGRLGVMMQAHHEVEHLFDVGRDAFDPPPRVESAVLRMTPLAVARCADRHALERVLAAAFAQRRKMIRNTLLPWLAAEGLQQSVPALSPTARPEEIGVDVYCAIADALAHSRTA